MFTSIFFLIEMQSNRFLFIYISAGQLYYVSFLSQVKCCISKLVHNTCNILVSFCLRIENCCQYKENNVIHIEALAVNVLFNLTYTV